MGCKNGKPVLRPEDKEALAKASGLSETEIEVKFEAFLKEHPDGKLRRKDFREMISQACFFSLVLLLIFIFIVSRFT